MVFRGEPHPKVLPWALGLCFYWLFLSGLPIAYLILHIHCFPGRKTWKNYFKGKNLVTVSEMRRELCRGFVVVQKEAPVPFCPPLGTRPRPQPQG
jgi:hypothetical protein